MGFGGPLETHRSESEDLRRNERTHANAGSNERKRKMKKRKEREKQR
jgi:hypothetical protein